MQNSPQSNRTNGDKDAVLANVALLYYGQGLTQSEIAKRMQVSRATIVNMLRESREKGIVEIRVDGKHLSTSNLARDLREKFGLADVYVALSDERKNRSDRQDLLAHVAQVGAAAVLDIAEAGDRIGVAWGETVLALSDVMPKAKIDDLEICQLIGSMTSSRVPASENCAIQMANKLSATVFTLHAPGIVATPQLANTFRNEPTIKAQLERLDAIDMTIASIGNISPETHLADAGMATTSEIKAARDAGAVGIICCRYIDAQGAALQMEPDARLIAISLASLRKPRKRLLVVCGIDRSDATLAALRGGLVSHLCVDHDLAEDLLSR